MLFFSTPTPVGERQKLWEFFFFISSLQKKKVKQENPEISNKVQK